MRVVIPHLHLHPLALEALQRHAPDGDLVDLGTGEEAYWRFLCSCWRDRESLLIIEQDIVIHEAVLPELEVCGEPWCSFGYAGPTDGSRGPVGELLTRSLGCTRFSGELMVALPRFMSELPAHSWRRLDAVIAPGLMQAGYQVHVHEPSVTQHHAYLIYGQWVCSCGADHESFPIDNEGRFCPIGA